MELDTKQQILIAFFTLLIFICTVVVVAKINYKNGKIMMCNEEGKIYTPDDRCINKHQDKLKSFGICLNDSCGGSLNATILQS